MSDLKTVLIVEDHPFFSDGLKGGIEAGIGYEVVGRPLMLKRDFGLPGSLSLILLLLILNCQVKKTELN